MSETQETPAREAPAPPPPGPIEKAKAYVAAVERALEALTEQSGIESIDPVVLVDLANVQANIAQAQALNAIGHLLGSVIMAGPQPSALFVPGR